MLTRAWLRRGPMACALWPLSLLFGALGALRRLLFRSGLLASTRLPVPVIIVGNIFIGGTGKTPLTIWLAGALRTAGFSPAIISRGHGGAGSAPRLVDAASLAREVGDEPLLMAQRSGCPVMVGRDRPAAGLALLAQFPDVDVIISDDGLQHYALQRDIEIVLFDGRGAGNGWLLPAGPLREPLSRRRDFTVVNSAAADDSKLPGPLFVMRLAGTVAEQLIDRGNRVPLAQLRGKRIVAAAGIGNPGRFFATVRAAGLQVDELPLPDHHDFLDDPFAGLSADIILITEKDAVKCGQIENLKRDPRLWVVPVTAELDAALAEQIVEKCRGCSTA
ncbi:MAG: tetraacyldisaccharide 4-kinase [Massilia sp.]|nr:tetraacyldisaccharide 4-kinase [Massilia sp.]